MFALAILIGIYSYLIFSLGILGILDKGSVALSTVLFFAGTVIYFRKNPIDLPRVNLKKKSLRPFLLLFGILALVNLTGALAPELSFDALWYHLTIPKIFIQEGRIFFIHGGLFYYSLMPKLTEMLFIPGLIFGNEITAKLIQWGFGILTSFVVYKISREFFDEKISFLSALVFYSSILVAWESTVSYVDLSRAFFDSMALWGLINYLRTKSRKWLIEFSVMIGLATSVKFIAILSIPIFIIILLITQKDRLKAVKSSILVVLISILIAFPWFFFSFINSGNPIYPFFTSHFQGVESGLIHAGLWNPIYAGKAFYALFINATDPISPVYVIFLPLIFIFRKKFKSELKPIFIYSALALLMWYPFAQVGGSRFILGYLPAFSVLAGGVIAVASPLHLKRYLIAIVVILCLITIGYRGIANARYLPVILGQEKRSEFLTNNLNFSFGDFYDTDLWFANNIKPADKVLLYGFHNLYYADFPFIHESYIKEGDSFNYIATQYANLPERFSHWKLIYRNSKTGVNVYTLDKGIWYY